MGKRITKSSSTKEGEVVNWWDDKPAALPREERPIKEQQGHDTKVKQEAQGVEGVKTESEDATMEPATIKQEEASGCSVKAEPKDETMETPAAKQEAADERNVKTEPKDEIMDSSTVKQEEDAIANEGPAPLSAFREDQLLRKGYRITPEVLKRLRETIEAYKGSHNFWNFTVGKDFGDRSCQRVMKNLTVGILYAHICEWH